MPKIGVSVAEMVSGIREFFGVYSPDFLWVPVSGGKDSSAVWGLVAVAGLPYAAVFIQVPGLTVADNIGVVESLATRLGVKDSRTVVVRETGRVRSLLEEAISSCTLPCLLRVLPFTPRGEGFWGAMLRYGFPAPLGRFGRGTRWCCGTFKHRVLNRLPFNGFMGSQPWRFGVDGSKATDSPYRARVYRSDVMTWARTRDTYYLPLRTLSDGDVWALLAELGIDSVVRPQYLKWGRAPNCFFCPMLGKSAMRRAAEAMTPQQRSLVVKHLKAVLPRYREGTYSYRAIRAWLEVLGV